MVVYRSSNHSIRDTWKELDSILEDDQTLLITGDFNICFIENKSNRLICSFYGGETYLGVMLSGAKIMDYKYLYYQGELFGGGTKRYGQTDTKTDRGTFQNLGTTLPTL